MLDINLVGVAFGPWFQLQIKAVNLCDKKFGQRKPKIKNKGASDIDYLSIVSVPMQREPLMYLAFRLPDPCWNIVTEHVVSYLFSISLNYFGENQIREVIRKVQNAYNLSIKAKDGSKDERKIYAISDLGGFHIFLFGWSVFCCG